MCFGCRETIYPVEDICAVERQQITGQGATDCFASRAAMVAMVKAAVGLHMFQPYFVLSHDTLRGCYQQSLHLPCCIIGLMQIGKPRQQHDISANLLGASPELLTVVNNR
jgi:hypothetical protein